jgi:hypothetical protein
MYRRYIQVIPLYFESDVVARQYFNDYKDEIDAITSGHLHVILPETVATGNSYDVVSAVASKRYPGLTNSDIPCLWVEAPREGHFVVPLDNDILQVKQIIRVLTDCAMHTTSLESMKEAVFAAMKPKNSELPKVPSWFPIAGYSALVLTLLFLMGITLAAIAGNAVPDNTRMLIVFIVAIGIALAASFLGGDAVAKGSVPLPFVQERPIAFTVGGGIAAFVIVVLIGYYVYGNV